MRRSPECCATRRPFAAGCAADPGSKSPFHVSEWVPALRCSVKNAAPRPGHDIHSPSTPPEQCGLFKNANSHPPLQRLADLVEPLGVLDGGRHRPGLAVGDLLDSAAQDLARSGLG